MFSRDFTCFHVFSYVFMCFLMFARVFMCFHVFSEAAREASSEGQLGRPAREATRMGQRIWPSQNLRLGRPARECWYIEGAEIVVLTR